MSDTVKIPAVGGGSDLCTTGTPCVNAGPAAPTKASPWENVRPVGHAEAKEIALRLIAGSFGLNDKRPRFSIPCRPDHDDDCLMMAYIFQQERNANNA